MEADFKRNLMLMLTSKMKKRVTSQRRQIVSAS